MIFLPLILAHGRSYIAFRGKDLRPLAVFAAWGTVFLRKSARRIGIPDEIDA